MNKLLFFSLLVLCSSVNALEISYPMFKTCYLDANSVPHQVTRNFTQAMKDAMLGGRGVVFNKKPPGLISEPNKYLGFYVSSPIIPSIDGPNCIVDYTTNTLECSIHNSRSMFWNLPPQAMPMFYEEFVQENLDLGTTQGQFDGLINLLVMAMNDAGNGYVSIDGFGRLRTTENGTMVGYSGIEYVDFNSFMATSASVSPYTGNCADFVGKGTSNPETLGIGGIIAGGFKIENVTGTAPVPIGTSAIVSIAVMADGYYTLRYQYPNDFFGPPKTILNTDVNKIVLTTGSGNEQIEISVFSKDLLPTSVTPINQPIQKPFRIGTTGVKNEKKYPELKLERNAGYKYECSVTSGTCAPSGGDVNFYEGSIATDVTITQGTVSGGVTQLNGSSSLTLQGFSSILTGNVTGGFLGTDNNRWTVIFKMPTLVTSVTINSINFYIGANRVTATSFFGGTCATGTLANLNDNNLTTTCVVNTTSHPGRWVMFTGFFSVTQRGITSVVMQMNSRTIDYFLVTMQNGIETNLSPASTTITNNYTTPCNYAAISDTHACSADTHYCSLFDNHACTTTACTSTPATATCNWAYEEPPECSCTPCSCSGSTGGCTVNKVANPLATLGFLTPTNTVTVPWQDGYFETDSDFGDLDSGNYSASCLFEEKYFKVQVVKTGTGTGTVTVNPIGGTSCGADCWKYPENTQIGLVAVPSSDSTMAGWTGCNAIFALDGDKNCTVTFNLKPASTCPTANVCVNSFRTLLATTLGQYGTTVIDDVGYLTVTLADGTVITGFVTRLVKDGDPGPGSVATFPEVVTRIYSGESSILASWIAQPCPPLPAGQQCLDRRAAYQAQYDALLNPYTPDQYDPLESDFKAANLTDAEVTPLADMDGNGLVDYEVKINGTPDYYGIMYIT